MDKKYLRNNQYLDSKNLDARISLHQQYSTNPINLWDWTSSQYHLKNNDKILEVGCGTGDFWKTQRNKLPLNIEITLSDFSEGILNQCRVNLDNPPWQFCLADVEDLCFNNDSYDWVLAHMMLYHTKSKEKALFEIKRVLRPNGCTGILTVGDTHMSRLIPTDSDNMTITFNESIADKIIPTYFKKFEKHIYEDCLIIQDIGPIIAYLHSSPSFKNKSLSDQNKIVNTINFEIQSRGSFSVPKRLVLYICHK